MIEQIQQQEEGNNTARTTNITTNSNNNNNNNNNASLKLMDIDLSTTDDPNIRTIETKTKVAKLLLLPSSAPVPPIATCQICLKNQGEY